MNEFQAHAISRRKLLEGVGLSAAYLLSACGSGGTTSADGEGDLTSDPPMPLPGATLPVAELPAWVKAGTRYSWIEVPLTTSLTAVDPLKDAAYNPNFQYILKNE